MFKNVLILNILTTNHLKDTKGNISIKMKKVNKQSVK